MSSSLPSAAGSRSGRRRRRSAQVRAALLLGTLTLGCAVGVPGTVKDAAAAAEPDTLAPGQGLRAGSGLTAVGGGYRFVMQGDGNLVEYASNGTPRWSTGTWGNAGASLQFQSDGNIVLYSAAGRPIWATGTYGAAPATRLVMQGDGNPVAYAASGRAVWVLGSLVTTTTEGTYTSPNREFAAVVQPDGNFVLTYTGAATADPLWSSGTWGHPNAHLVAQTDGNLVMYDGNSALWSSGTDGNPGAHAVLQTDGNFVVYSPGGRPLFHTGTSNASAGVQRPGDARFTLKWSHAFADQTAPIGLGSPGLGTLDGGGPAAIVGDRAGGLYAFHLSDGSTVPGWPVGTGGVAVDSTPSVVGSGAGAQVLVGLGTSARPQAGGIMAVNANGSVRWNHALAAYPVGEPYDTSGVMASAAVGHLEGPPGQLAVTAGTMRQMQFAYNTDTGTTLPGFPWFGADSNFTTPALADLYGRGTDVIVEGGDSSAGNAFWTQYQNGGHIRILNPTGNLGLAKPSDGLVCQYDTDQVVQSSPAVGHFLAGGRTGIVAGTGTWFPGASDTNKLIALDANCRLSWKVALDGPTGASPSLVDVLGSGTAAVVEGTNSSPTSGSVYALDGATGNVLWRTPVGGGVYGSITSIDLGGGYQSLLVPTATGVYLLDGRSGRVVNKLVDSVGVLNTVLVTADPGGLLGVTIAGYNGVNRSVVMHYTLTGSQSRTASGRGQWPMFHADPHLSGLAHE